MQKSKLHFSLWHILPGGIISFDLIGIVSFSLKKEHWRVQLIIFWFSVFYGDVL